MEGDLEEGGAPATGGRAAVAAEAATAASARVATDSAVRVAVADHQMVLPCAPSDDEKVYVPLLVASESDTLKGGAT